MATLAVFAGLLAMFVAVGQRELLRDPGTLWHTAAGERMLEMGAVLRADPFTWTRAGAPWVAMQWLAECVMALAFRIGGYDALLVGAAATLAALYAWLFGRARARGVQAVAAVAWLALVLAASSHHFHARPHLATLALLPVVVALLAHVEDGGRVAWTMALAPLVALWSNVHGGALGGVATIAVVAAGWTAERVVRGSGPLASGRDVLLAWGAVGAAAAATLVNPYGAALPRTWLVLSSSPVLARTIAEHAPLGTEGGDLAVWTAIAVYAGLLASVPWRQMRTTWLVPLVWSLLAVKSVRHAPLFAAVMAVALPDVLRASRLVARLREGSPFALDPPRSAASARARAGAVAGGVGVTIAVMSMAARASWAQPHPSIAPLGLLPALAAVDVAPAGVLDDMRYGGFLIRYARHLRPLLDDRWELHGDAVFAEWADALDRDGAIALAWADRFDLRYALVRTGSRPDAALAASPRFRPLAQADGATLYGPR